MYPPIATAIIVLIQKGDEILLVHNRAFKRDYYGLVAGFLEAGENLEQCVRREVMEETGLTIKNLHLNGNYSFQNCRNVTIENSELNTKDAFWESENVTVINSTINGEYLGWHSKNLRLVNCRISGTQPLCYAENLIMENCTMATDADLAFEYSSVNATINSEITSVKNPLSGSIKAKGYGLIIIDNFKKEQADCDISILES